MKGPMKDFMSDLRAQPLPGRYALVGVLLAGFVGAIAGLVIGLHVYAATAWAAMFELGIPAAIAGGVVGFLVGSVVSIVHRLRRNGTDLVP
jgi:uncharacterized membrane-anchored protein